MTACRCRRLVTSRAARNAPRCSDTVLGARSCRRARVPVEAGSARDSSSAARVRPRSRASASDCPVRARLPQLGDPPGRVGQRRLGRRVAGRGQARPAEHAGHEQQPRPAQVQPPRRHALNHDGPAGPPHPWMQLAEHPLQPVVGQGLGAERHVRLQPVAQPRPVRCDQQLPALLQQVRGQVPGGGRVIQQFPATRRHRGAVPLGQRPPDFVRHLFRRGGTDPGELGRDVHVAAGRDRAEEVRGPAVARGEHQQRAQVQPLHLRPHRLQPGQVVLVPLWFDDHPERVHDLPQRRHHEPGPR